MATAPMQPVTSGWKSQWRIELESRRAQDASAEARRDQQRTVLRRTAAPPTRKPSVPRDPDNPSRQLIWARKQRAAGNCIVCGATRDKRSKSRCARCLAAANAKAPEGTSVARLRA